MGATLMLCGLGASSVVGQAVDAVTRAEFIVTDAEGIHRLKPDKAHGFLTLLTEQPLIAMVGAGGDAYVSRLDPILGTTMIPCPSTQIAGAYANGGQVRAWVDAQLSDGNAVLVSLVSVVANQAMCAILRPMPAADREALAAASEDMPLLAEPTGLQKTMSFFTGGFGMLVALAGVAGVLAWASGAFSKKKFLSNLRVVKRWARPGRGHCPHHVVREDVLYQAVPGVGQKSGKLYQRVRRCSSCGMESGERYAANRRRRRR